MQGDQLADPLLGQCQHGGEIIVAERPVFGGRLHLHDIALGRQDIIGIRVGLRILRVIQIEHRGAVIDASTHRSDEIGQRQGRDLLFRHQTAKGELQRHRRSGDRRRARAAVGLNDIAIDPDLALAQCF